MTQPLDPGTNEKTAFTDAVTAFLNKVWPGAISTEAKGLYESVIKFRQQVLEGNASEFFNDHHRLAPITGDYLRDVNYQDTGPSGFEVFHVAFQQYLRHQRANNAEYYDAEAAMFEAAKEVIKFREKQELQSRRTDTTHNVFILVLAVLATWGFTYGLTKKSEQERADKEIEQKVLYEIEKIKKKLDQAGNKIQRAQSSPAAESAKLPETEREK